MIHCKLVEQILDYKTFFNNIPVMPLLNSDSSENDGLEIPALSLFYNNTFMLTVALQLVLWAEGPRYWDILQYLFSLP